MNGASSVQQAFSQTYTEARGKFVGAAEAAGLPLQSHRHPLLGQDGETLAMDVARFGPADAPRLLVITSACHGVEGFCGSGLQTALIRDSAFHTAARAAGVAVLYVHALNPYGFSHLRRVTHENVDLNRNFHDFTQPLPDNPGYRELHPMLLPPQWPPSPENEQALMAWVQRHGPDLVEALNGTVLLSIAFSTGVSFVFLIGVYRLLPNTTVSLREAVPGAVVGTVAFQLSFQALPLYLGFSESQPALKAFNGLVVLLIWLFLMSNVLLLGAQVNHWYGRARPALRATPAELRG